MLATKSILIRPWSPNHMFYAKNIHQTSAPLPHFGKLIEPLEYRSVRIYEFVYLLNHSDLSE